VLFSDLDELPPDVILGIAQAFRADSSSSKIDLGIGIYKDDQARSPVLPSVKAAESWLTNHQASKSYLSSSGNPEFNIAIAELLFGPDCDAAYNGRIRSVQTPGGSGALRVIADFLRVNFPTAKIWLPNPTWATHQPIFAACGLNIQRYPYYDLSTNKLLFDEMLGALQSAKANDIVVLHGCCHNPTGEDLEQSHWHSVADSLQQTGAIPLIDLAYQGFGEGLDEDAYSVRLLAKLLPELFVASSCSKNFSLYRDRVGALTTIAQSRSVSATLQEHIAKAVRVNYSMPPDHGASVVAHILKHPELRIQWELELGTMRTRIAAMRSLFAQELTKNAKRDYSAIARQKGMFSLLNLTPDVISRLREVHHIYMISTGRINVAGLTLETVAHVAASIAEVQSHTAI
jgi:aspartate aminotransferase